MGDQKDKMHPSILGQNLRHLRLKADMTQPEFSEVAGIAVPTLANLENGYSQDMRGKYLLAISKAVGVPIETLLSVPLYKMEPQPDENAWRHRRKGPQLTPAERMRYGRV